MAQGTPNFAISPIAAAAVVQAANTSRAAPTNPVVVVAAGQAGCRIERVVVAPTGTTTAGVVSLYLYDGANYRFYFDLPVPGVTVTTTTRINVQTLEAVTAPHLMPLVLPPGWSLVATVSVAQANPINVFAIGGNF